MYNLVFDTKTDYTALCKFLKMTNNNPEINSIIDIIESSETINLKDIFSENLYNNNDLSSIAVMAYCTIF